MGSTYLLASAALAITSFLLASSAVLGLVPGVTSQLLSGLLIYGPLGTWVALSEYKNKRMKEEHRSERNAAWKEVAMLRKEQQKVGNEQTRELTKIRTILERQDN